MLKSRIILNSGDLGVPLTIALIIDGITTHPHLADAKAMRSMAALSWSQSPLIDLLSVFWRACEKKLF